MTFILQERIVTPAVGIPQSVFCSPSEPNIPEGPEYEKYQHYIDAWGYICLSHSKYWNVKCKLA